MENTDVLRNIFENTIFPQYLLDSTNNERTRTEYKGYVRILEQKFTQKPFIDLTEDDALRAFEVMKGMISTGDLSRRTVCVRLSCYNSIAKYIEKNFPELEYINPFRLVSRPQITDDVQLVNIPSMEELDKIITAAKETSYMYYLILALATRVGLSATNIVKIRKQNIVTVNEGHSLIALPPKSESKEPLEVMLPEDVSQILNKYLETNTIHKDGFLFVNKHNKPLTLKNLDDNVAKIISKSGIANHYTIKDLRTRSILEMVNAGASDKDIATYTGLGGLRLNQYHMAKGTLSCPADLVNYRLCDPA